MKLISVFLVLLLMQTLTLQAAEPDVDCKKDSGSYVTGYCTAKEYEAADAKLNAAYKQLQSLLDLQNKSKLKHIQMEWIKYRDATCDFETEPTTGKTGMSTFTNECLTRITQNRIADLEAAIGFWSP